MGIHSKLLISYSLVSCIQNKQKTILSSPHKKKPLLYHSNIIQLFFLFKLRISGLRISIKFFEVCQIKMLNLIFGNIELFYFSLLIVKIK